MGKSIFSLVAAVGVLGACTSTVESVGSVSSAMNCSYQGCGANAATVGDGIVFDEIDASGQLADPSGLQLVGAWAAGGRPVSIDVVGDQLRATALDYPTDTYATPQQLQDMVLRLSHTDGAEYELRINFVSMTTYWTVRPGDIPVYQLYVRKTKLSGSGLPESELDPPGPGRPICTGKNLDTAAETQALPYGALMFAGDRFDDGHKTVTLVPAPDPAQPPGPRWFNLACIGTSMAKMHFLRHTTAGSFSNNGTPVSTTPAQRQAMLKMLTADYCGNGHSFTVNGRPLAYQDSMDWYTLYRVDLERLDDFEAVWGPNGAICLSQPRLAKVDEIQGYCITHKRPMIPTCTKDMKLNWRSYGHVASSNAVVPTPSAP
jgi:hypothetical protein